MRAEREKRAHVVHAEEGRSQGEFQGDAELQLAVGATLTFVAEQGDVAMADKVPARLKEYMDFTSPDNPQGLHMDFAKADRGVTSTFTIPDFMAGWRTPNVVGAHPGAVDTALNTAMGWAAATVLQKAAFQKSASFDYLELVPVGTKLRCDARVIHKRGKDETVVEARIVGEKNTLLAKSVGTFLMFGYDELGAGDARFAAMAGGRCAVAFATAIKP
jgi:acyl-coenzyme A thioesterase PaaI-like protein